MIPTLMRRSRKVPAHFSNHVGGTVVIEVLEQVGDKEARLYIRRPILHWMLMTLMWVASVSAVSLEEPVQYELGVDSLRQQEVPRGDLYMHLWKSDKSYPGTIRRYWVYVPKQYDSSNPASLMVFQDGHAYVSESGDFRVPTVFDNLIHQGDMPVTLV